MSEKQPVIHRDITIVARSEKAAHNFLDAIAEMVLEQVEQELEKEKKDSE